MANQKDLFRWIDIWVLRILFVAGRFQIAGGMVWQVIGCVGTVRTVYDHAHCGLAAHHGGKRADRHSTVGILPYGPPCSSVGSPSHFESTH